MRSVPFLLLVSGVALTSACGATGPQQVETSSAAARTITAHPGGTGTFRAGSDVVVSLGHRGTITGVEVALGATVSQGQPLFEISSAELDRARDELDVRAAADAATLAVLRAQQPSLSGQGARTQAQADKVAAAKARLDLDQRLLQQAQDTSRLVRAPVAGVVSDLAVQPGTAVTGSVPLLHVIDAGTVRMDAQVSLAYRGQIPLGTSVDLRSSADAPVHLTGTVVGLSPDAVPNGQTFTVSVQADDPDRRAVPGTAGYARFEVVRQAPVAVNRLAVRNASTRPTVLVVQDGRARLRDVVLGVADDDAVEVVQGLRDGERVVLSGAQTLQDGERVRAEGTDAAP